MRTFLRLLVSCVALLVPLALVAPVQASIYDSLTVTDPKGDNEFAKNGYHFPDLVAVRYYHLTTSSGAKTFQVTYQMRKDIRWGRLDNTGVKTNGYYVGSGWNGDYTAHIVTINKPDGTQFTCHVCSFSVNKTNRTATIKVPWSRLGSPSHISIGRAFAEQGIVRDTVKAPSRALY